jgi:hypothetical protein
MHSYVDKNFILVKSGCYTYFVKAMSPYKDKDMLVIPFNTGNRWVLLSICTTYDQVWYCYSSRLVDSKTGDQLTCDFSDVMSVLDD